MEKQFVTYKIALKLKELGFNEDCLGKWSTNGHLHTIHYGISGFRNDDGLTYIKAPLWQQAIDWFRKRYNLNIEICVSSSNWWYYMIPEFDEDSTTLSITKYKKCASYNKARQNAVLMSIQYIKNHTFTRIH